MTWQVAAAAKKRTKLISVPSDGSTAGKPSPPPSVECPAVTQRRVLRCPAQLTQRSVDGTGGCLAKRSVE